MIFSKQSRVAACVSAFAFLMAPASHAQNAMQTNVRSATVYDGVTYAQLLKIFSEVKFNDAPFTIVEHGQPGSTPYFSLSTPHLPFPMFVGAAEEGYSGVGDGVHAGFVLFTPINSLGITQEQVNNFNYQTKFVKYSPSQSSGIFAAEYLAAGGVTEQGILSSLLPFLGGLSRLVKVADEQTVSFSEDIGEQAHIIDSVEGRNIIMADWPTAPTKISTSRLSTPADQRLIVDFVEVATQGRR